MPKPGVELVPRKRRVIPDGFAWCGWHQQAHPKGEFAKGLSNPQGVQTVCRVGVAEWYKADRTTTARRRKLEGQPWKCPTCGVVKPLTEEFWTRNHAEKSGFGGECRECNAKKRFNYNHSPEGTAVNRKYDQSPAGKAVVVRKESRNRTRWSQESPFGEKALAQYGVTKRCPKCAEHPRAREWWYLASQRHDGLNPVCVRCQSKAASRRWRTKEKPFEKLAAAALLLMFRQVHHRRRRDFARVILAGLMTGVFKVRLSTQRADTLLAGYLDGHEGPITETDLRRMRVMFPLSTSCR